MCHTLPSQTLSLARNQIGDTGVAALADVCAKGALPQLTKLYLHRNKISDDGFAILFPLLKKDGKLSSITGFGIGSGITDKGMKLEGVCRYSRHGRAGAVAGELTPHCLGFMP